MTRRRVAVTGVGMVTPVGNDAGTAWNNMLGGVNGIGRITQFDPTGLPSTIAGEVKDFNPESVLPSKELRKMDRFIQHGKVAAI